MASNFYACKTYDAIYFGLQKSFKTINSDIVFSHASLHGLFCLLWIGCAWPLTCPVCLLQSPPLSPPGKECSLSCTRCCIGPEGALCYRSAPCWEIMSVLWVIVSNEFKASAFSWGDLKSGMDFFHLPLAGISMALTNGSANPAPALLSASCFVCSFVRKPCISIPHLSSEMSREQW